MEKRTFGRTDMQVSALGLGTAEIGYEGASLETVDRMLGAALDAGVNVLDTAECYVDSEEKLGSVLGSRRADFFVFTKCGHASGLEGQDWDPSTLSRSIDRSLQRLRVDYVDLLQLHSCSADVLRHGGVVEVLQRARESGKTRFIGYSGDSADAAYAVQSGVFDSLQTSLSVADQEAIELTLAQAHQKGMGVIAKRPIANTAWKHASVAPDAYYYIYWQRLRELQYPFIKLSLQSSVSTALRFTLAVDGVSLAIVGTKNAERWTENTRILQAGPLPGTDFEAIRQQWRNVAAPDWTGQT